MKRYNLPTITPRELFKNGLDSAVLWNIDRDKELEVEIAIALSLKNGYHSSVIKTLVNIFGKKLVLNSIQKYQDSLSPKLISQVKEILKKLLSNRT